MIPDKSVVENEFSDAYRSEAAPRNVNITTRITGVPKIVDEAPEVYIDKKKQQ